MKKNLGFFSILELKSQVASGQQMDQKMAFLYTNITTIKTQISTLKESVSSLGPDMDFIHTDVNKCKTEIADLAKDVSLGKTRN